MCHIGGINHCTSVPYSRGQYLLFHYFLQLIQKDIQSESQSERYSTDKTKF